MERYLGLKEYEHTATPATGILLVNLGSPAAPTTAAVRRYLAEFLWDPRMVEIPRPLWWLLLHGLVLRTRPARSAKAYQAIWRAEGSPLVHYTRQIAEKLQATFPDKQTTVRCAMRYGTPHIAAALEDLRQQAPAQLIILPLFPQYSAATTASVFDKVSATLRHWRWLPRLHFINHYADNPVYITAIANSITQHWQQQPRGETLLFSFHGLPKRNLQQGDPYYCYCHKTARLVAEQLGLAKNQWQMVFQSRFGKAEWLQPYCVDTLITLAKNGTKTVDVVCPGFAVDCLETLEEIAMQNQEIFIHAGGHCLNYIPALNDSPDQITLMRHLIEIQQPPSAGADFSSQQ